MKVSILLLSTVLYSHLVAQPLIGKKLNSIPNLIKLDSTISILTKSAQTENAIVLLINSIYYECVLDDHEFITYISTVDKKFVTPDSVKVRDTYADVKRKLRKKGGYIIQMPGWGKYIELESGWNAVFDFRKKISKHSRVLFFFQRSM